MLKFHLNGIQEADRSEAEIPPNARHLLREDRRQEAGDRKQEIGSRR